MPEGIGHGGVVWTVTDTPSDLSGTTVSGLGGTNFGTLGLSGDQKVY